MSNSASAAREISACSNSTGIFGGSVGEKSWTAGSTGTDGAEARAAAWRHGHMGRAEPERRGLGRLEADRLGNLLLERDYAVQAAGQ